VFERVHRLYLSWPRWVHSSPSFPPSLFLRFSHASYMTEPSNSSWLYNLIIFGEQHKLRNHSVCRFLQHPVTSLLGPDIFLSNLFSDIFNRRPSSGRETKFHTCGKRNNLSWMVESQNFASSMKYILPQNKIFYLSQPLNIANVIWTDRCPATLWYGSEV
jgi:hypothetical protein